MFYFKDNLNVIVWLDLFSVNHHTPKSKPSEWWTTTLQSTIKQIGQTVMVFAPWQDHVPLRHTLCLWELYTTVKMECKFDIAMSQSDRAILL